MYRLSKYNISTSSHNYHRREKELKIKNWTEDDEQGSSEKQAESWNYHKWIECLIVEIIIVSQFIIFCLWYLLLCVFVVLYTKGQYCLISKNVQYLFTLRQVHKL